MSEEAARYEVAVLTENYDLDAALARWNYYQELQRRVLTKDDWVNIKGKRALKRSGFAKLRIVVGAAAEIVEEKRFERDGVFGYQFMVRVTAPDGRSEIGDGICQSTEKQDRNMPATEHNVRSHALTRAKNRATADLIGGGIVSAEELDNGEPERKVQPRRQRPEPAEPTRVEPQKQNGNGWNWNHFWSQIKNQMRMTQAEVHELFGVATMKDYQGTMEEALDACAIFAEKRDAGLAE